LEIEDIPARDLPTPAPSPAPPTGAGSRSGPGSQIRRYVHVPKRPRSPGRPAPAAPDPVKPRD